METYSISIFLNIINLYLPFRRAEREKIALWAILANSRHAGKIREGQTKGKRNFRILFEKPFIFS
jgi:hypothetical protein